MAELTLVQAINLALAHEMAADERVLVLGEDVGVNGGVFRATEGLLQRFGRSRVIDTPLAELLIAGMSVGLAAEGFRPVAEIQFSGFIYPTLDQIVNHASRLRNRTRGRLTCPMVLRSALRRRGPCAGAPLRKSRSDVRACARPAGRHSVFAIGGLWAAAGRHPRPRSRGLP